MPRRQISRRVVSLVVATPQHGSSAKLARRHGSKTRPPCCHPGDAASLA